MCLVPSRTHQRSSQHASSVRRPDLDTTKARSHVLRTGLAWIMRNEKRRGFMKYSGYGIGDGVRVK
ncbi:hypothetical protein EDE08_106348 [Bradyrhizobium sp. R2.2-H]|jgi:hypothetical protein|nr:hypothetical protein EDE10_10658 [Bradyrhizobium sp. Y-H1]TCU73288.1 hypothetical protein EDE08_106348 [Bradyrhizobium sp. R2.2-H]